MKIINLTPHTIVVGTKEYPASGIVARVEMQSIAVDEIDGFPVVENKILGHNIPDPVDGTLYLVSAMILNMGKELGRTDLIAPDTNRATRNEKGHIVSVPGFVK
jgi:hypothetical protein